MKEQHNTVAHNEFPLRKPSSSCSKYLALVVHCIDYTFNPEILHFTVIFNKGPRIILPITLCFAILQTDIVLICYQGQYLVTVLILVIL